MHKVVEEDMKTEKEALSGIWEEEDAELLDSDKEGSGSDVGGAKREEERLKRNGAVNGYGSAVASPSRKYKYDEDEDYNSDANGESSSGGDDSAEESFEEESDGESYNTSRRRSSRSTSKRSVKQRTSSRRGDKKKSYTEVDEEEIGTADEDSEDEG